MDRSGSCANCGKSRSATTLWRRTPDGLGWLCNSCGVRAAAAAEVAARRACVARAERDRARDRQREREKERERERLRERGREKERARQRERRGGGKEWLPTPGAGVVGLRSRPAPTPSRSPSVSHAGPAEAPAERSPSPVERRKGWGVGGREGWRERGGFEVDGEREKEKEQERRERESQKAEVSEMPPTPVIEPEFEPKLKPQPQPKPQPEPQPEPKPLPDPEPEPRPEVLPEAKRRVDPPRRVEPERRVKLYVEEENERNVDESSSGESGSESGRSDSGSSGESESNSGSASASGSSSSASDSSSSSGSDSESDSESSSESSSGEAAISSAEDSDEIPPKRKDLRKKKAGSPPACFGRPKSSAAVGRLKGSGAVGRPRASAGPSAKSDSSKLPKFRLKVKLPNPVPLTVLPAVKHSPKKRPRTPASFADNPPEKTLSSARKLICCGTKEDQKKRRQFVLFLTADDILLDARVESIVCKASQTVAGFKGASVLDAICEMMVRAPRKSGRNSAQLRIARSKNVKDCVALRKAIASKMKKNEAVSALFGDDDGALNVGHEMSLGTVARGDGRGRKVGRGGLVSKGLSRQESKSGVAGKTTVVPEVTADVKVETGKYLRGRGRGRARGRPRGRPRGSGRGSALGAGVHRNLPSSPSSSKSLEPPPKRRRAGSRFVVKDDSFSPDEVDDEDMNVNDDEGGNSGSDDDGNAEGRTGYEKLATKGTKRPAAVVMSAPPAAAVSPVPLKRGPGRPRKRRASGVEIFEATGQKVVSKRARFAEAVSDADEEEDVDDEEDTIEVDAVALAEMRARRKAAKKLVRRNKSGGAKRGRGRPPGRGKTTPGKGKSIFLIPPRREMRDDFDSDDDGSSSAAVTRSKGKSGRESKGKSSASKKRARNGGFMLPAKTANPAGLARGRSSVHFEISDAEGVEDDELSSASQAMALRAELLELRERLDGEVAKNAELEEIIHLHGAEPDAAAEHAKVEQLEITVKEKDRELAARDSMIREREGQMAERSRRISSLVLELTETRDSLNAAREAATAAEEASNTLANISTAAASGAQPQSTNTLGRGEGSENIGGHQQGSELVERVFALEHHLEELNLELRAVTWKCEQQQEDLMNTYLANKQFLDKFYDLRRDKVYSFACDVCSKALQASCRARPGQKAPMDVRSLRGDGGGRVDASESESAVASRVGKGATREGVGSGQTARGL